MSKLISANFLRLFKSFIFKLYMIFSAASGLFFVIMQYIDYISNKSYYDSVPAEFHTVDEIAFVGGLYLIFAAAVFTGIFIGTEYSDGTIRNKLVVGHNRAAIYLSNLIVCMAANIIAVVLNAALVLGIGSVLLGVASLTVPIAAENIFYIILAMMSFTALSIAFSMLISSKSGGSVTVLVTLIVMLFGAVILIESLSLPEYNGGYSYTLENGETIEEPIEKNPNYVSGTKRKVYENLVDAIPTGQLCSVVLGQPMHEMKMIAYDFIIITASTGIGLFLFKKKDLK